MKMKAGIVKRLIDLEKNTLEAHQIADKAVREFREQIKGKRHMITGNTRFCPDAYRDFRCRQCYIDDIIVSDGKILATCRVIKTQGEGTIYIRSFLPYFENFNILEN